MIWRGGSFKPVGEMIVNTFHDVNPARYAAKLVEDIGSLHRHFAAKQPDWWQQVLIELHDRLAENFLADKESGGRHKSQLENRAALMAMPKAATATGAPWKTQPPPWKPQAGNNDSGLGIKELLAQFKAEHPEGNYAGRLFDDRPEQHNANGLRILALENQVAAITDWADIRYIPNEVGDYVAKDSIHTLIAEGMTGVSADMKKDVDELYGLFDAMHQQTLKLKARLDALETKTPC